MPQRRSCLHFHAACDAAEGARVPYFASAGEAARRHARRLLAELADRDLATRAAAELRGMLMPPAAAAGAQARKEVRVGCRGGE